MSNGVYNIHSGEKVDHVINWESINQKIAEDINYLQQEKLNASFILLGKAEYRIVIAFFSEQQKRYFAPSSINGIPIVLVPIVNMCTCIPSPPDLNGLLL